MRLTSISMERPILEKILLGSQSPIDVAYIQIAFSFIQGLSSSESVEGLSLSQRSSTRRYLALKRAGN